MARKPKILEVEPQRAPEPLRTYGYEHGGDNWGQHEYNIAAFSKRISIDQGAPQRLTLFRAIADRINPGWFEWHDWTNKLISTVCDNRWVGVTGCSSSCKTRNIAGFACTWWLVAPFCSSVIYCSTTAKAMRRRGWAEVQNFHTSIPGPRVGNFVDSRMLWQCEKGDDRNAMMGIAVEEGETTKVADNIKGVHTLRQMVIIDEATAVPVAIMDAVTNLYSFPREFILVMLGNARARLDQFGMFIEPKNGWDSVTLDDEEWETGPKIDGQTGICIRFDVEKSPNIIKPLAGGALVSKYLPTKERVAQRKLSPDFENDPTYWSNERGFPPPEGIDKHIFSEVAILKSDGYGKHAFTGDDFFILGAVDPARLGGDRPTLRWGACGRIEGGTWGIEWMPPKLIPLDARSNNPVDYQIVEFVKAESERVNYRGLIYHCEPSNLGVDATGGGADLVDIFQRIWSPDVLRVIFSARASEDPISHEDIRPASSVYLNKRAEMYYRTRTALDAKQIKGIDRDTAREICTIEWVFTRNVRAVIPKADYKKKYNKSPDLSDSAVILTEVARIRGFRIAAVGKTVERSQEVAEQVKAMEEAHNPETFYQPGEEEDDDMAVSTDFWG